MKVLILSLLSCLLVFGDEFSDVDFALSHNNQYRECSMELDELKEQLQKKDELIKRLTKQLKVTMELNSTEDEVEEQDEADENISLFVDEVADIEEIEAHSYRLIEDSDIYDGEGNVINMWNVDTVFTSNKKAGKYTKITGYFIDDKWKPAQKDMWIETKSVTVK